MIHYAEMHRLPEPRVFSPRYTDWDVIYANQFIDSVAPPASALRAWESTPMYAPVEQYSNVTAADAQTRLWVVPAHIYRPNGVDVYVGYAPGASWTSGLYQWRFGYFGRKRNGGSALGSGTWTYSHANSTPSAATDLIEYKILNMVVGDDDEVFNLQVWLDISNTTADDIGELFWIRLEFDAWRNGGRMHPGARP